MNAYSNIRATFRWSTLSAFAIAFSLGIAFAASHPWTEQSGLRSKSAGNELTASQWNQLVTNVDNLNERLDSAETAITSPSSATPTGAVVAFFGTACPNGWSPTDGTANGVKKTDGTAGTLDLRGQFVRGLNASASGIDPNRTLASSQSSQNLSHGHAAGTLSAASAGAHTHTFGYTDSSTTNSHSQGVDFQSDTTTARNT